MHLLLCSNCNVLEYTPLQPPDVQHHDAELRREVLIDWNFRCCSFSAVSRSERPCRLP